MHFWLLGPHNPHPWASTMAPRTVVSTWTLPSSTLFTLTFYSYPKPLLIFHNLFGYFKSLGLLQPGLGMVIVDSVFLDVRYYVSTFYSLALIIFSTIP